MTIICRIPLVMLFISPSLGAGPGADEISNEKYHTSIVDFTALTPSKAQVSICTGGEMDPSAQFTITHTDDSLCGLEWQSGETRLDARSLDLSIRLDPEQKAFTYVQASSMEGFFCRDLMIKEDDKELTVRALGHGCDLSDLEYPGVTVGARETPERLKAEELLSTKGPFSPFFHLKGDILEPLINSIASETDQIQCDKIFHFLAFNAPPGYSGGNLDWLFEFVRDNTMRIQRNIKNYKPKMQRLFEGLLRSRTSRRLRKLFGRKNVCDKTDGEQCYQNHQYRGWIITDQSAA